MAKLYFHYSSMNAGKSTVLLQASYNYHEQGMATYLLTARLDDRAGSGVIASRIGIAADAEKFGEADNLKDMITRQHSTKTIDCVLVDEAQFLSPEQVGSESGHGKNSVASLHNS